MEKIKSLEAYFVTVIRVIESKRIKWTILEIKHWVNDKYKQNAVTSSGRHIYRWRKM